MISILHNEAFLVLLAVNILLAWGLYPMVLTGQLSLGQAGFMAVGAYGSSWANARLGWPIALSIPFGIMLAAAVALPVAAGANRVRGVYLMVGTLAAGQVIVTTISSVGALGGARFFTGMDPVSAWQVWLVCLVVLVVLWALLRTRLGVVMRSIRDDEDAARSVGVHARGMKIGAVLLGAAITGLAGALDAHYLSVISPDGYGVDVSLLVALSVLVGGTDTLAGPVVGAFLLTYFPEGARILKEYEGVAFGLLLIVMMIFSSRGLITRERTIGFERWVRRCLGARSTDDGVHPPPRVAGPAPPRSTAGPAAPGHVFELRAVGKRFGGLVALDAVDLAVDAAEVVGLIGPNGAGKTTLVNVATGLLRPTTGRVLLRGIDVTSLSPERRVERGSARTFQRVRLFRQLSVRENVAVPTRPRARAEPIRDSPLSRVGLDGSANRLPGELPYGLQRRLQVAVALACDPVVLFLDEPSIGLDSAETAELAELVRSVRADGTAIILVDHNLDLVFKVADRVVVLDFGRKIAEGTADGVARDPVVQSAYLGMATGTPP